MIEGGPVFGELVRAIKPYLSEVVFVGGWVHALYILESDGSVRGIVRTADIDLSLPHALDPGTRDPLSELIARAGFEIQAVDGAGEVTEIFRDAVDLDLLAEAPSEQTPVEIMGQPDLRVSGYPHQDMLRENARWIEVGPEIDPKMEPPESIRVPKVHAYSIGKLLSSARRTNDTKKAKDLVYLNGLLEREHLRALIGDLMPELKAAYPEEVALAKTWLEHVLDDQRIGENVADQIIAASGYEIEDPTPIRAQVMARFRRFLAETLKTS
jgi:hypothetical protein